jgi:hypothetical protein
MKLVNQSPETVDFIILPGGDHGTLRPGESKQFDFAPKQYEVQFIPPHGRAAIFADTKATVTFSLTATTGADAEGGPSQVAPDGAA